MGFALGEELAEVRGAVRELCDGSAPATGASSSRTATRRSSSAR